MPGSLPRAGAPDRTRRNFGGTPSLGRAPHAAGMPRPVLPLLLSFARTQALSCLFAFTVVGLLAVARVLPLGEWGVARYDFLLVGCVAAQLVLIAVRFESWREAGVILAFHALGFALEAFKVAHGSWAYPDAALSKVLGVPLYAGFMYASVGSYMAQAWKRHGLRLAGAPPVPVQVGLAAAAYLNFFGHHYGPDLRWAVTAGLILAFRRTWVVFRVSDRTVRLPLLLAFALIGLFVFLAENVATFLGAWVYPDQHAGWRVVSASKWLAWTLMVVVAFLIVSVLKGWEARLAAGTRAPAVRAAARPRPLRPAPPGLPARSPERPSR